jgi:hypothetical protein
LARAAGSGQSMTRPGKRAIAMQVRYAQSRTIYVRVTRP